MSCYARKKKEKLHETFVSLKINSRDHYYPCNFLQPIKFDNLGLRQKDILPQVIKPNKDVFVLRSYICMIFVWYFVVFENVLFRFC